MEYDRRECRTQSTDVLRRHIHCSAVDFATRGIILFRLESTIQSPITTADGVIPFTETCGGGAKLRHRIWDLRSRLALHGLPVTTVGDR